MKYRELQYNEINVQLFKDFNRYQEVTHSWRKINGEWVIQENKFIDQWDKNDFEELVICLRTTTETGGVVFGAFDKGMLKGFASVEGIPLGMKQEYLDLTSLHVSSELRGKGIGSELFKLACTWAKKQRAKKLYISAHSSVESQGFYKSLGCIEAVEYDNSHIERAPNDCQLEYVL